MRHYIFSLCPDPIPFDVEAYANLTVNAAKIVHDKIGPGLKEKTYEKCLAKELMKKGLSVKRQVDFPVIYDGEPLDDYYRIDMIVEDRVVVEIKTVDKIYPAHRSQVLRYLKICNMRLGVLINFNSEKFYDGVRRIAL